MTHLRTILTLLALCVPTALGAGAHADTGSAADGSDSAGLDVVSVSHSNDGETATYRLEFSRPIRLEDVYTLLWEFDFNDDGIVGEACIRFSRLGSTGILRGSLSKDCGPETWATADARFVDGNAIEMALQLIDLAECCGLRSGTYGYKVTTRDHSATFDEAPDQALAQHAGVDVPAPRPQSDGTTQGSSGDEDRGLIGSIGAAIGGAIGSVAGGVTDAFTFAARGLCSGPSCMLLGLGAPVVLGVLTLFALRARRRRLQARSRPGHVPFASASAPIDSVRDVLGDSTR